MTEKTNRFNSKNYVQEIEAITSEINAFKKSGDKADESFLKVGELLVQTKNDKQLTDKHFTRLKTIVAESLGKSGLRNINKVVAVAQCEAIQKNKDTLPKSWSTLAVLATAPNVAELITSVKVDSTRSEITRLVKTGKVTSPLKWVYVELTSEHKDYTEQQIEELKELLNGSNWMVKLKKSEPIVKVEPPKKTRKTKKNN